MKNLFIGILFVTTVVCSGLFLQQHNKAVDAEATVTTLRQEMTDLEAKVAQQEKQAATLQSRLQYSREEAVAKTSQAEQLQQALTNRPAPEVHTNSKPANAFAGMFKDPEMKEMVKTQQKTAFERNFKKNYAKLFTDMHLSPEQTAAVKDLLLNKQMAGADLGMSMLGDDMDPAKRTELFQQIKTEKDGIDAQIKQLLGDDAFAQLQTYEKAQPDRAAVNGFKNQLSNGDMPLNKDQEDQLTQVLTQERQAFKFTTDFGDQSKFNGDFENYFSEDKLNQYFEEQDRLNQQYLARAQSILTPAQFEAFQKHLEDQKGPQRMGLKMAAKMFGSKPAGGGN